MATSPTEAKPSGGFRALWRFLPMLWPKGQAELKMRNRTAYHDLSLVFAREWEDLHKKYDSLGLPLHMTTIGQQQFARLEPVEVNIQNSAHSDVIGVRAQGFAIGLA